MVAGAISEVLIRVKPLVQSKLPKGLRWRVENGSKRADGAQERTS